VDESVQLSLLEYPLGESRDIVEIGKIANEGRGIAQVTCELITCRRVPIHDQNVSP
jgi:hypothetical protein